MEPFETRKPQMRARCDYSFVEREAAGMDRIAGWDGRRANRLPHEGPTDAAVKSRRSRW